MDTRFFMKSIVEAQNYMNKKPWFRHTPFIGDDDDDGQENTLHEDFYYETEDRHVIIDETQSKLKNVTLTQEEWSIVNESLRFVYETATINLEALDKILNELEHQLCSQKQTPWSW